MTSQVNNTTLNDPNAHKRFEFAAECRRQFAELPEDWQDAIKMDPFSAEAEAFYLQVRITIELREAESGE